MKRRVFSVLGLIVCLTYAVEANAYPRTAPPASPTIAVLTPTPTIDIDQPAHIDLTENCLKKSAGSNFCYFCGLYCTPDLESPGEDPADFDQACVNAVNQVCSQAAAQSSSASSSFPSMPQPQPAPVQPDAPASGMSSSWAWSPEY